MDYLSQISALEQKKKISHELAANLKNWHSSYLKAAETTGVSQDFCEQVLQKFLQFVMEEAKNPYEFEPYHTKITSPDYYKFGIDFIRPIVVKNQSTVHNENNIVQIEKQLGKQENVILFSNHQTELDPQAISFLLEDTHPRLAENMIFVAGHRVTTDPIAIPFSKGRNLLCIYSKKYIEDDPATKEAKLLHNQRTMKKMSELLSEGGKCIYVAPSGGRDRPNKEGKLEVPEFNPQSIEMFWLMAQKASKETHFYPLALSTYNLLPPPDIVVSQVGEMRTTQATPIHLAIGQEIPMENFPGHDHPDKKGRRKLRAEFVRTQVAELYGNLK